jgi:hypothetical protein
MYVTVLEHDIGRNLLEYHAVKDRQGSVLSVMNLRVP